MNILKFIILSTLLMVIISSCTKTEGNNTVIRINNQYTFSHTSIKSLTLTKTNVFIPSPKNTPQQSVSPTSQLFPQWNNIGLNGRTISQIAISKLDSNTIYLATDGGVYKSTNRGITWGVFPINIKSDIVYGIVIDPNIQSIIYAFTEDNIYKSIDGGVSWKLWDNGLKFILFNTIEINPINSKDIIVGTEGSGIFRSVDGGLYWSSLEIGSKRNSCWRIIFSYRNKNEIYVGTEEGIYKSEDNGITWIGINNGLPKIIVTDLLIDPVKPSTMYVIIDQNRVYKSIDNGNHWAEIDNGINNYFVFQMVINPINRGVLYIATSDGIYKTVDGGYDWYLINLKITHSISSISIDPNDPTRIYIGTNGGGIFLLQDIE